jgi:hypothetical protein
MMRCRRVCRELLWLARFGEFGPSSQPHLDHLANCRSCRDEVGFDRAMVQQLRVALAERIADANPSSNAWERILARAQTPEPAPAARLWEWSAALVGRLRFATAMAGTGLALVLALNTQIVPVFAPATSDADAAGFERSTLEQVPRMPMEVSSLEQLAREWGGPATGAQRPDPETALTVVARAQAPRPAVPAESADEPEQAATAELRLVFRPMQTPDPAASDAAPIEPEGPTWTRATSEPGEPS